MSPTKPGNYKAYNLLHKINYWKLKGEDPAFLFDNLDIEYQRVKETDWLDFKTQVRVVWDNELKKVPNPRDHEAMGYDVYRNASMGSLEVLAKLLSLQAIFKQFVRLSRQYSLVENYEIRNQHKNSVTLIYAPKKRFYEHFGTSSPLFIKGFLKAIPKIYEPTFANQEEQIPDARVDLTLNCFDLDTVLKKDYAYLTDEENIKLTNEVLFISGKQYAKKINLAIEREKLDKFHGLYLIHKKPSKYLYASEKAKSTIYLENPLDKEGTGFLILEDYWIGDTLVLKKDEIYDAPYCRFDVSWHSIPYKVRAKYALRDLPEVWKSSRHKLLEQLEVADQRYFNEIQARRRVETTEQELRSAHTQLQRYSEHLEDIVEERTAQLIQEEKVRRIYQVRAAQADAVARFLHQTSNLVLQPLASTMIVFEDFIEIIEDCRSEWALDKAEDELYRELDECLKRIQHVYPTASRVINGYRALFHAFYEIYVSTKLERDINQDLRYIETLVRNKYILTQVELELELDPKVPPLKLEGGVQSIFLELMYNAARHGASHILVRSFYDSDADKVKLFFYNDGNPIVEDEWEETADHALSKKGRGFGMVDAKYVIDTLNNGCLRLSKSEIDRFSILFVIELDIF